MLRALQTLALCNLFVPCHDLTESDDNSSEEDTRAEQGFKLMSVDLSRVEHGACDGHSGHDGVNSGIMSAGGRGTTAGTDNGRGGRWQWWYYNYNAGDGDDNLRDGDSDHGNAAGVIDVGNGDCSSGPGGPGDCWLWTRVEVGIE